MPYLRVHANVSIIAFRTKRPMRHSGRHNHNISGRNVHLDASRSSLVTLTTQNQCRLPLENRWKLQLDAYTVGGHVDDRIPYCEP